MIDLNSYLPKAQEIATLIDDFMIDELKLAPPMAYDLSTRGERVYLVASYNPLVMGRSIKVYEHPEVARRLKLALGMPVAITRETGTRYVVLMHGALSLPKLVQFPAGPGEPDVFRLGVGLKGEIRMHARQLRNVMIGAAQGVGKSTILELLTRQMLAFGWRLYLADPQLHTFNPDVWNQRAAMGVAGSKEDMLKVLAAIEEELATRVMQFRMSSMDGKIPADIDDYNSEAFRGVVPAPLPRMGFVIDEANYFLASKSIFARMADLLRQGRKWGLHIVVAAHEWHKDTIPAGVNDLLQTRIALSSLSGPLVLRSNHWGKWVEGRPPGRGVLRTNRYEPMQFYMVGDALPLGEVGVSDVPPITAVEAALVRRSLREVDGKFTGDLLMVWGLSEGERRELGTRWESLGWLAKRPDRANARFVTAELVHLVEKFYPNPQTEQTAQTAGIPFQTDSKPAQRAQT